MESFSLHQYFQAISDQHVILSYKGALNIDLLTILLDMTEKRLARNEARLRVKKKVFHVLVEVLQNMYHYSDNSEHPSEEYFSIIFLIRKIDEEYVIYAGNYLQNDEIEQLEKRLDQANSLNREELRAYYRQQLNRGTWSEQGGAGLGFLDIIKKSGNAISYQVMPVSDQYSFFSMEVHI